MRVWERWRCVGVWWKVVAGGGGEWVLGEVGKDGGKSGRGLRGAVDG